MGLDRNMERIHEENDMPRPAIARENLMGYSGLPTAAKAKESEVPILTTRGMMGASMGPKKERQYNMRVLRSPGDVEKAEQRITRKNTQHFNDCQQRGPTMDKKALWSIAHGGI